jgi:hypothetical protein
LHHKLAARSCSQEFAFGVRGLRAPLRGSERGERGLIIRRESIVRLTFLNMILVERNGGVFAEFIISKYKLYKYYI